MAAYTEGMLSSRMRHLRPKSGEMTRVHRRGRGWTNDIIMRRSSVRSLEEAGVEAGRSEAGARAWRVALVGSRDAAMLESELDGPRREVTVPVRLMTPSPSRHSARPRRL